MKNNKIFISIVLGFLSLTSYTNAQGWETVSKAGFSDGVASFIYQGIAIDHNGTPYIVYEADSVHGFKATVMKYDGSSWVTVGYGGISAGGVYYTSIAIDGNNIPYIVYNDGAHSGRATVMKYIDSSWVVVGKAGFSSGGVMYPSIAIDGKGIPYVVYVDGGNNGKATVMTFNGSNWVTVGVAGFSAGRVEFTSIAIDGNGTPYVVYEDYANSDKASVMKYNDSSWVSVGIPGFSASWAENTCIAIDSSGSPYVVYVDGGYRIASTVMKFNDSSWVAVGYAGFSEPYVENTSIAINDKGTPYVVFTNYEGKASAMNYNGNSWVSLGNYSGFSAGGAEEPCIAIDSSDILYVLYCDDANGYKATVMKYVSADGINEFQVSSSKFQVEVYPNPVEEITNIKYQITNKSQITISIYDLVGREIDKIDNGKLTIDNEEHSEKYDAGKLKSGVYFLKIESDNNVSVTKFIKE